MSDQNSDLLITLYLCNRELLCQIVTLRESIKKRKRNAIFLYT